MSNKSLVPVPRRRSAKGPQISFRRVCAFKPHKVGPKQFDSRLCLYGFRQRAGTYDPVRVSTPVCRRYSDRLKTAWGAGRSDVQSQVGDADMWVEPPPERGLPPGMVLQVANSLLGLMQACYNWGEKLNKVLTAIGAVPFETDPRSFVLVRRDAQGQRVKTFCHAHLDDLKLIGQEVPYLMGKIGDRVQTTWKDLQPESCCGVQDAYGAGNETFVYMKDSADALLALRKTSGIM
jgi:hypothetical protein